MTRHSAGKLARLVTGGLWTLAILATSKVGPIAEGAFALTRDDVINTRPLKKFLASLRRNR